MAPRRFEELSATGGSVPALDRVEVVPLEPKPSQRNLRFRKVCAQEGPHTVRSPKEEPSSTRQTECLGSEHS